MKEPINLNFIKTSLKFVKLLRLPLTKHMKEYGNLTESQFVVLEVLYAKGTLSMNEIIGSSLSSDGNIGVVINNLIKQGLVEKKTDEIDRRIRRISLSKQGRIKMDNYFPIHEEKINSLLLSISDEEKNNLIDLLKKIGKQLNF